MILQLVHGGLFEATEDAAKVLTTPTRVIRGKTAR